MSFRLSILSVFIVISCSCTYHDPGYQGLDAKAYTGSNANEIVGAWFRTYNDGFGGNLSETIYFKADGTGYYDKLRSGAIITHEDKTREFSWSYQGNGIWKTHTAPYAGHTWKVSRDSQGKALLGTYFDAAAMASTFRYVYRPVEL